MPNAQNLLRIVARHIGERYVYGARVAKDNPNHRGPWDCAEFVSWCVYQESQRLYGCDNNRATPSRALIFMRGLRGENKARSQNLSCPDSS
jgi:N-acetylmuramoyl-L-alanine amidase